MHTHGRFLYASRNMDDELCITLAVDDIDLEKIKDIQLDIDLEKHSEKKSLRALRYFWKLCTLIAQVIGSDKDTVYLLQLQKYGCYLDLYVESKAVPALMTQYRHSEIIDVYEDYSYVRCYYGLSLYTQDQIRHLLDGTVRDAEDLGIETWSKEEIEELIRNWRGAA